MSDEKIEHVAPSEGANRKFSKCYEADEFRLLYESTIHVTEWRNAANRFYYSISVAIFVAMGAIFFFGYQQSNSILIRMLAIFSATVVTVFGLFVARTWEQLLDYYYGLNEAKFDTMREVDPENIFEFEYSIFRRLKSDGRVRQIKARKVEKTAPYVALIAFSLSCVVCAGLLTSMIWELINGGA